MKENIIGDILTYKIDTEEAIKIKDVIKSLKSFSEEYSKFSKQTDIDIKLYEVRKGSFEFDLILTSLHPILPMMSDINTTTEFIKKIIDLKNYFLNNTENNSNLPSIEEAKFISDISKPISIVNNGTINVYENNDNISVNITKDENIKIQENTTKYIEKIKDEKKNYFKDKLIYFVQTRNDNKDYGNKSICKDISDKELKTIFDNERIKEDILDNPYHYAYLVDLEVQYVGDEPKLYKIVKLNDKIEINENDI